MREVALALSFSLSLCAVTAASAQQRHALAPDGTRSNLPSKPTAPASAKAELEPSPSTASRRAQGHSPTRSHSRSRRARPSTWGSDTGTGVNDDLPDALCFRWQAQQPDAQAPARRLRAGRKSGLSRAVA